MAGYTIDLDLRGRRVLVVGLGAVGRRKAEGLLRAEAIVRGVDPADGLEAPAGVEHLVEAFRPEHLEGVELAFAAATPEVNRVVVLESQRAGIWVNAASEPGQGDFTVPAVWREGLIGLSVTTSSAGPALARGLRDRAAAAIAGGPTLAELTAELRPIVLETITDPAVRRAVLTAWGDPRWLDVLDARGRAAVERAWREILNDVARRAGGG